MTRQQLEMRLDGDLARRQPMRFRRRNSRARWWFDQMRLAVEQAPDGHLAATVHPPHLAH